MNKTNKVAVLPGKKKTKQIWKHLKTLGPFFLTRPAGANYAEANYVEIKKEKSGKLLNQPINPSTSIQHNALTSVKGINLLYDTSNKWHQWEGVILILVSVSKY